jgi:hypothetical protein
LVVERGSEQLQLPQLVRTIEFLRSIALKFIIKMVLVDVVEIVVPTQALVHIAQQAPMDHLQQMQV